MSKALNGTLYRIVYFLFFVSFPLVFSAQTLPDKIAFEKYGVAEGLPEEYVRSMVQDNQGFMWFTTQNGLVKFDGYKMKVFKGTEYKLGSKKLAFRSLSQLIKSKDGKLWMGSVFHAGGIASYNPITETFKNYVSNPKDSTIIPFQLSQIMFEDHSNNIWFNIWNSSDSSVIGRIKPKTHKIKTYPIKTNLGRINGILLNLAMLESEADKNVWIKDIDGNILVLNREKDEFELVIPSGSEIPGSGIKDTIRTITKGHRDSFLMSGDHNLFIWDPIKKKSIESYTDLTDKDNKLSNNKIRYTFKDALGQYWVVHRDFKITLIDPVNNTTSKLTYGKGVLDFTKDLKGPVREFIPIFKNQEGIWFHIWNELKDAFLYYQFSTKSFAYYNMQFNDSKNSIIRPSNFFKMLVDDTGLLWLGDRPNFYKQSPKTRQMELFRHDEEDNNTIPSDTIRSLFEDSIHRLWVGTLSGLSVKLEDDSFKQLYYRDNNGKQSDLGSIRKIYEDAIGNIWVGTVENGLLRLNESKQEFQRVESIKGDEVINISEDKTNALWVSVFNKGVYILDIKTLKLIKKFEPDTKDTHGLLSNKIFSMFLNSQGSMWLGDPLDNDFGLFKYNEKDQNFKHYKRDDADSLTIGSNEIRTIIEDDLNRIWVATDGGINLYDHENDVFYKRKKGFDISSVRKIIKAENGKIWAATYASSGLALVGPGINNIEIYGEDKGLLHNDGTDLVLDDYGKLWLPTERGLSVFDTNTKTYSSYFERDGFQKNGRFNTSIKTKNGDIWIGGDNGLNRIVPNKLSKKDMIVPSVYITAIGIMDSLYSEPDGQIFKKSVSYSDQIKLNHWQKDLSFDFVALHYLRPEDNLYSWKLENYDTDWSIPSKDRRTAYTNLSPGEYTFRVKGSNADGIWNEEGASIHITIAPPWWLTWWAYTLYGLVLLYVGYRVHLYQRARTLKKAQEAAQQKELEQAKEIKKAYADLKATQSQLIQSEKMASLGELTAGIAHEIQNPLNFVNNFSELNTELIEELEEEMESGNLDEVKTLAKDIKENEKKINHHGKRADSIVKGMLQHSRSSNGEKEPTELNVLADEYLRLAYHGLRAKDKTFNATMETNFDKKIGKISVVPQDIGRVVLNLITNAFHAVQDKKKEEKEPYEPTVTVSTKKIGNTIEISVKDNGQGIPKKIIKKIFQPFFTTKPSGRGTGLGLSMSYEIVTIGHGGTLMVESEEGKGTEFKINLPA